MLDSAPGYVILALILLIGLFLTRTGLRSFRIGRHIRNTPPAKPGSVAAGRAEVRGETKPYGDPIEAPFTGEECVYLDWTIEERVDGEWREVASETQIEPFFVAGESGEVLVRADEHPNIEDLPWEYDSRRFTEAEAHEVEAFLSGRGSEEFGGATVENPATTTDPSQRTEPSGETADVGEDKYRYIKRLLPPGVPVYVFGSIEPQYDIGQVGFETDPVTNMFIVTRSREDLLGDKAYFIGMFTVLSGLFFLAIGIFAGLGPAMELLEWVLERGGG